MTAIVAWLISALLVISYADHFTIARTFDELTRVCDGGVAIGLLALHRCAPLSIAGSLAAHENTKVTRGQNFSLRGRTGDGAGHDQTEK